MLNVRCRFPPLTTNNTEPPPKCCPRCNARENFAGCCDLCDPSIIKELLSRYPLDPKPPSKKRIIKVAPWSMTKRDEELRDAVCAWREAAWHIRTKGRPHSLVGSYAFMSDAVIQRLADLGHIGACSTREELIHQVDWAYIDRHADELLRILSQFSPPPPTPEPIAEPLPSTSAHPPSTTPRPTLAPGIRKRNTCKRCGKSGHNSTMFLTLERRIFYSTSYTVVRTCKLITVQPVPPT